VRARRLEPWGARNETRAVGALCCSLLIERKRDKKKQHGSTVARHMRLHFLLGMRHVDNNIYDGFSIDFSFLVAELIFFIAVLGLFRVLL